MTYMFTHLLLLAAAAADSTPSKCPDDGAAVKAIKAQSERFSRAYMAEDVDTMVSIYAPDGVAAPGGSEFVRGSAALARYWQPIKGTDIKHHVARQQEIVVDCKQAYDWGYYEGAAASGGQTQAFRGKYLIVWQLGNDGVWRMAQDMWNSLQAPPAQKPG